MAESMNDITQDEINDLHLGKTTVDEDIKNLTILITNELKTLDKSLEMYSEKSKKKIEKNLNRLLNKAIDIRKL